MKAYKVRAVKWREGWELHVDGEGVTQVRTLAKAERQVRDYLESLHDRDFSDAVVVLDVKVNERLDAMIKQARKDVAAAAAAQRAAAQRSRKVAEDLRKNGLSVTDTAAALGVSRGRVSQLTKTGTQ